MLSLWNPARKIGYFVGVWSGLGETNGFFTADMDKDDWKTNIRLGKTIWPLCAKRFPKVKRTLLFFKDPPTSTLGFGSRLWEPILTPAKALRARPRSRLQRPS